MMLWLLAGLVCGVAAAVVIAAVVLGARRQEERALFELLAGKHHVHFDAERRRQLRRLWWRMGGPLQ